MDSLRYLNDNAISMQQALDNFETFNADQIPELLKLVDMTLQKLSSTFTFNQRPKKNSTKRDHMGQAGNLARMLGFAIDQNVRISGFAIVQGKLVYYSTEHNSGNMESGNLTVSEASNGQGFVHSIKCFNQHGIGIRIFRDNITQHVSRSSFGAVISQHCDHIDDIAGTPKRKRPNRIAVTHLPQPSSFNNPVPIPQNISAAQALEGEGGDGLGNCGPSASTGDAVDTLPPFDPDSWWNHSNQLFESENTDLPLSRTSSPPPAPPPPPRSVSPPPPPPPPPVVMQAPCNLAPRPSTELGSRLNLFDIDTVFEGGEWLLLVKTDDVIYKYGDIHFLYLEKYEFEVVDATKLEFMYTISRPHFLPLSQVRLLHGHLPPKSNSPS